MNLDTRNPFPVLTGAKLELFYSILTLWESGKQPKVVNNFKSMAVKRFLAKRDSHGKTVLTISTDKTKKCVGCKYILYLNDSKQNKGLSLLYHLRNAFAHNDITLSNQGQLIHINHVWKGVLKLKTIISFKVLKELIETIRGQQITPIENNK